MPPASYAEKPSPLVLQMLNAYGDSTEMIKSRYEIPKELTQLRPRSHPRHLVGKRTAQKDAIKNTTSDNPRVNPITLRKAKIVYNFGLSECNRVMVMLDPENADK